MSTGREWVHTGYAQRVHFGQASAERIGEIVKEAGARRILLVTTEGRLASQDGSRIADRLGRALVSVFTGVRSHVPAKAVESAVRQAQDDSIDGLVSFGGGSCADAAKAVCFFLEQQAGTPGSSYLDRPMIPHVAVPTTYSGAELTPFFGMTDEATKRKSGAGGPTIAPVAAVYDPLLTLTTPVSVSAETGMNALAHGIECAYSPHRSPEAEAIAVACVSAIARSLPAVVADPGNIEARASMLVGAFLGGRCLQNASMGVHHGLAQLVGGRTGMPHGLANAILLAHAISFNASAVSDEMTRIGFALGAATDPSEACDELRQRLGIPGKLSQCGMTEDDLDVVARLSQSSVSVASNPRPVTEDDARSILLAAF